MAKRKPILTSRVSQLMERDTEETREKLRRVINAYLDPEELEKQQAVIRRNEEAQNAISEMDDLLDSVTNPHYGELEYKGRWYPKELVRKIRDIEKEYAAQWNKPFIEMTRNLTLGKKKKSVQRPIIPVDYDELARQRDSEISQLIAEYEGFHDDIRPPIDDDGDIGYKDTPYNWWVQEWITRLTPGFMELNKRVKELMENNLTSKALETLISYGYLNEDYQIDIAELRDDLAGQGKIGIQTLQHLNLVVMQFLNDNGSTVDGAIHEMAIEAQRVYRGKFGKEWLDRGGKTWDTSVIKEMHLKRVFELYRRIEELPDNAALIGTRYQAGVYGSDNLIEFIYDLVNDGYDNDDVLSIVQKELDNYAYETREHFYTKKKEISENNFTATSEDFSDFIDRMEW